MIVYEIARRAMNLSAKEEIEGSQIGDDFVLFLVK